MRITVIVILLCILFLPNALSEDYTKIGLPDGATARLGKGPISGIAYSPDGTRLAVSSTMGFWLYDTATFQEVPLLDRPTRAILNVAFSPDGKVLACLSSQQMRLWNPVTGEYLRAFAVPAESSVHRLWFSSDGNTLVGASYGNNTISFWDAATGKSLRTLTLEAKQSSILAFSPETGMFASGHSRKIHLADAVTGKHLRILKGRKFEVHCIGFSRDGGTLASGRWGEIDLWHTVTGKHLRTLAGHHRAISGVAFSPDGKTLASAGIDNTVRLWDTGSGHHLRTLTGHKDGVFRLAFSPDGSTVVSASGDHTVRVWDVLTGKLRHTIHRAHVLGHERGVQSRRQDACQCRGFIFHINSTVGCLFGETSAYALQGFFVDLKHSVQPGRKHSCVRELRQNGTPVGCLDRGA